MEPKIYHENEHGIKNRYIAENALKVLRRLSSAGFEAYLVGGGVRDLLLGQQPKDFDIVTDAHPNEVHSLFRNSRIIGRRFRLVHVLFGRDVVEVATFRATDEEESRHYQTDQTGFLVRDNIYGSIDQDAFRRDFTINSLYYDPEKREVIDYCGGFNDLKLGLIRLIGEPEERFREDPVRILRAARFKAKLGFKIDEALIAPMEEYSHLLNLVSSSRMYDEVIKLFLTGHGVETYKVLLEHNLFHLLFPDTYRVLKEEGFKGHLLVASLDNSDMRHHSGQSSSPYFLYASLLWAAFNEALEEMVKGGARGNGAIKAAADEVFSRQNRITSFPRYVRDFVTDLWFFQNRLMAEHIDDSERVMKHERFKAAYDFLLLRAVAEESDEVIRRANEWRLLWTEFERENPTEATKPKKRERRPRPRRRRRS